MNHALKPAVPPGAEPLDGERGPFHRIEEVAARTGLTRRTIRYYEELGLLEPPARTEGHYRLYTEADVARLMHIRRLKDALGLSLKEIQQMIAAEEEHAELRATFQAPSAREQRLAALERANMLTREQIALVERKMESLRELRATLEARLARYAQGRAALAGTDTEEAVAPEQQADRG